MNPVALVTGSSRGIGRGIALALAEIGWDLMLNYVSNESAAAVCAAECVRKAQSQRHQIQVETCQADVSSTQDRERLVSAARRVFCRVDLLVNNAGVAPDQRADILDATETSFDRLISTNLKGPYFLTQQIARWMIEQHQNSIPGETQRFRKKIINISSISAYTASTNRGDYCLSKAGVSMLTALFAARLAEDGINVFEIRPGIIATDMTEQVKPKYDKLINEGLTPIRRWGTSEDVGKAVAAIAQDLFPFSTGEVINVDGGFHLRRL